MDIKSISTLSLPSAYTNQKTQAQSSQSEMPNICGTGDYGQRKSKKSLKKLPYVAAGVVLAGFGIYAAGRKIKAFREKKFIEKVVDEIAQDLKQETPEVVTEVKTEIKKGADKIHEEMRKKISPNVLPQNRNNTIDNMKIILPEGTVKVSQESNVLKKEIAALQSQVQTENPARGQLCLPLPQPKKEKFVCIGFNNGKPVYEPAEKFAAQDLEPAASAFKEARKGIKFLNDEIIAKIMKSKKENAAEVNRIIAENTKDGHIDLNMMRKVAHDFSTDEAGRGADRFHQAAEILEQSYIREFIKKDGSDVKGVYNLYDFMKTDSELFSIYTQMPAEEVANRLNYIRYNDILRGGVEKDMKPEAFVEKMFDKLVEKIQFQKYNEAHKGMEIKVGV